MRKLRAMDGGESAGITILKHFLRDDGVLAPDGKVRGERYAAVEKLDDGTYRVKLVGE